MSAVPPPPLSFLPALIFSSRWLQLPLYLGLIVAQCVYVFLFLKELWHLIHGANTLGEQGIMLLVLIVLCSLFHRSRSCSCGSVCLRLCR